MSEYFYDVYDDENEGFYDTYDDKSDWFIRNCRFLSISNHSLEQHI